MPLASAAAVNVIHRFLLEALERTGLPVTGSSGGLTKYNRTRLGIPKTRDLNANGALNTLALGHERLAGGIPVLWGGVDVN